MIEPPVPHDCNLGDFKFMPLEVARLRRSKAWLVAKRKPEIGFYMINLWTAAWHNVPAGSLEDDDDTLADQAMCEPKRWPKVRADALRGWVKASDGRLYHNTVSEKVIEAWKAKHDQRSRTDAARRAKEEKRHKGNGAAASVTEVETEPVTKSVAARVTTPVTEVATEHVTASKGQGQGQGQGITNPASSAAASPPTPLDRLISVMKLDHKALHRRPNFQAFPALFHEWKQQGCDPEKDIWPTIERLANRSKDIGSPKFFEAAVLRARDDRIAAEPTEAERWSERIQAFRAEKFWSEHWGPAPGEPGCLVPAELLIEAAA